MLLKVADAIEKNLNTLAVAECLDNGKPIRECMAADLPLVIEEARHIRRLPKSWLHDRNDIHHNRIAGLVPRGRWGVGV